MNTRAMVRLLFVGALGALPLVLSAEAASVDAPLRTALAWQIALDRAGFSPGLIDGKPGPKTKLATREFQHAHRLAETGTLDADTAAALGADPEKALGTYIVEASDLAEIGPAPKGWVERSKLKRLAYPSLDEELAEKLHCTRALLAELNPGVTIASLKPADRFVGPALVGAGPAVRGERIDIDLSEKVIRVYGADGGVVALFHCSIAADRAKRPEGRAAVAVMANNPTYTFDPDKWPEVKDVNKKLEIPPGPRNPVGLCWIGLSLPGYGIHGSPTPELIGKTGSHGCFRLTNWDAIRLSRMIRVGTPVTFSE
jgi:lipoprotein-anchoring transpeptidase ErfK/SrfK